MTADDMAKKNAELIADLDGVFVESMDTATTFAWKINRDTGVIVAEEYGEEADVIATHEYRLVKIR